MQRYLDLCEKVAEPGRASVWEGEPLSLTRIAEKARARIEGGEDTEEVAIARAWLEAATGEALSHWYREHLLTNLSAGASLDTLIASGALQRFEPASRYFFGHKIPD
ncbi:hypothetical protein HV824_00755 [Myxococcus sp. AM009]|uniref:hypothetical protein n=1 Tax=unclassified Myxococcus TaxID=2648731 RepID=UPI0015957D32|nr:MULTISPECIES: hypothetical protein [unclassified Myxococcus]NVI96655.1 hypothetical protein [Myxococcus sp. AM009]NVJ12691.1 hypothetical protein [Myxococcus sp. AM010]